MRQTVLSLLIFSAIFGLSICEDAQKNITFDETHSYKLDDLVEQFYTVQNTNGNLDKDIFDALEDESVQNFAITATKFLSLLSHKQANSGAQIENLNTYQQLASDFVSANAN